MGCYLNVFLKNRRLVRFVTIVFKTPYYTTPEGAAYQYMSFHYCTYRSCVTITAHALNLN